LIHTDNLANAADVMFACFNSSGVSICVYEIKNSNLYKDFYCPIGIDQIISNLDKNLINGTDLVLVKNDVAYYDVLVIRQAITNSNTIRFEVNTDCSRFELFHLCWKDAYGSWLSYPFKYIQKDITEFERKQYYQKEGKFNMTNDTFGYDDFGRGDTSYFNRLRDKMILNSGWVSEFENDLLKDLLGSSSVMVQMPDNSMVGCMIENNKHEFRKKNTDYLFNYKLEIKLASNETRF